MATRKPVKPKAKKAKKRGRPSLWSPAIARKIIDQLSAGVNLVDICRAEGMPKVRTVNQWTEQRPQFSADFARAREEGCDAIAADILRIADTPMPGRIEKQELLGVIEGVDGDGNPSRVAMPNAAMVTTEVRVEDMLGHRKLQIDTRLKLLSVWSHRYNPSSKVEVTGRLTLEQLVEQSQAAPKP